MGPEEPEPLTEAQEAELVGSLRELVTQIRQAREEGRASAGTVDLEAPVGRLSRMDMLQQQKMAEASQRQLEAQLRAAERALEAADDGTFGECRSCEEPIGYRRLRARPESALCLRCQRARENG